MTAKETIIEFENALKDLIFVTISKRKEKDSNGWKLVYELEGIDIEEIYIPFLKVVFFMNNDMGDFTESTYLIDYGLDVITKTLGDSALVSLKDVEKLNEFDVFFKNAVNEFNQMFEDPFISITQIEGNDSLNTETKYLNFVLSRVNEEYEFSLKADFTEIIYDNVIYKITSLKEIYKIIKQQLNN